MKKLFFFVSISLSLFGTLRAQEDAAMMKAWTEFMTPGDMHKWMAKSNGTWNGDVSSYMEPGNATKWKATTTYQMIYNGLYQKGDYKGEMMGQPFEGQSLLAYDNAKKQFVTTWIDNMGSGIVVMTGQYDAKTKTLHLTGIQTDPMTKKDTPIREEIEFLNDDTQMITMYGNGKDGKEMKMMDIKMTRAK